MSRTNRICLCENCILAIKSHGEKLAVGDIIEQDDVENEEDYMPCEWCDDNTQDIYECFFI
ncbi:MAG: hypothetical protein J6W09_04440 [Bacteroidales bacterium]|nr:hypothetical protein [Bacteroidales bacterium]